MNPEQKRLIGTALSFHQTGNLEKALELYHEALRIDPTHSDNLLFIGIVYCQQNNFRTACDYFTQIEQSCVESNPNYYINYGLALSELSDYDNAIKMLKRGIELDPEAFEPHFNLGRCYFKKGMFKDAGDSFLKSLSISPNDPQALAYQGSVLIELGQYNEGLELLQRSFSQNGETSFIRQNIGYAFERQGNTIEAQKQYERALSLDDNNIQSYFGLSRTKSKQGFFKEAENILEGVRYRLSNKEEAILECNLSTIAHLQNDNVKAELHAKNALHINPESREANGLLALAYSNTNRQIEAVELFSKAVDTESPSQMHLINMSKNYTSIGMANEAIATSQKAFAIDVTSADAFSSLLLYLHYPSGISISDISTLHKQYGEVFSNSSNSENTTSKQTPAERLKIGFISGDFCAHPVQFFIEPLLQEIHNDGKVDVVLFSNTPKKDQVTEKLISYSQKLIDIRHLNDSEACSIIQAENVDALIDLSGHTNNNRLPLLAMKPAMTQLTYLGYPNTTGLKEIDYRITDNYSDPEGVDERYSEKLLRLDDCFLTYLPPEHPAAKITDSSSITFGSFNNIAKISDETVKMWCEILTKVENSKLLIKCHGLSSTDLEILLTKKFTENGITKDQIQYASRQPDFQKHLELYNSVDIALDTYPYNGTTTTFEALLMGRPVITLRGNTHVSSVGNSILTTLGFTEFIALSPTEYINKAVSLSQDISKLQDYHSSISQKMLESKLCDSKLFYKKFIEAVEKIMIIA